MKLFRHLMLIAVVAAPIHAMAAQGSFPTGVSYYGQPADASALVSAQSMDLSTTKGSWFEYGDTVVFKARDGRQFAWTFNGLDHRAIPLSWIAPQGFEVGAATANVGSNPLLRD